jgi:RNA polymerase sigma-B factor
MNAPRAAAAEADDHDAPAPGAGTPGPVPTPVRPARDDLAARRERGLFVRCRQGDPEARSALVERFLPLARSMAKRYERSGEPLEDLVQVACLGLVKAVDRFDPDKGVRFSSFAVPTILGELKRHFRDRTWAIHVPRSLNELVLKLDRVVESQTRALGRPPTVAELCEALEAGEEQVLEAIQARHARSAGSLDAPGRGGDEDADALVDRLGSERAASDYRAADDRLTLLPLLEAISPRDREVLRLRFEEDLTQQEIGERVGVSQMQVSRIIRASVTRLRVAARDA